jgi:micrococcal nuclease
MHTKVLKAKVVDVYDGDTCTIVYYQGTTAHKRKFRLYGVDSPELKVGKHVENRDQIKQRGLDARDALRNKILHRVVTIQFHKEEKFGRCMGVISYGGQNVNKWLVQEGYAKEYFGGKKQ